MHVKSHLDVNLVALDSADHVTLMLDLTAPVSTAIVDRPSQGVQVVLDSSGSMGGDRIESAKAAIFKLVDRLAPQDLFGLVTFDDQALVIAPTRRMVDHELTSLRRAIRNIDARNSTDMSAGYLMGLRQVHQHPADGGSTIILISDGHANSGEKDPRVMRDIAIKSANDRVTTSTIGIGTGYDETILEALAAGGGGAHRFASTMDEAMAALAEEVDDLLEKSVVNAVLRIRPLSGTQGAPQIEVLQRLPYWMEGADYLVQLGDLYSGENRRVVIGIEVPEITSIGLCKIAEITIEYLNLAEMAEVSVTLPVNVNVVPSDIAEGRVADAVVRAARLIIETQIDKSRAADELRGGNSERAATRLRANISNLRNEAMLIPLNDERYLEAVEIIKTEAEDLEILAQTAEREEASYSAKRMTESYSRGTRSKHPRNFPPAVQKEEGN